MSIGGTFQKLVGLAAGKPAPLRGTVQKISIMRGGQVSVVVRFGGEEPLARMLDQGSLVELFEIKKRPIKPKKPANESKGPQ